MSPLKAPQPENGSNGDKVPDGCDASSLGDSRSGTRSPCYGKCSARSRPHGDGQRTVESKIPATSSPVRNWLVGPPCCREVSGGERSKATTLAPTNQRLESDSDTVGVWNGVDVRLALISPTGSADCG